MAFPRKELKDQDNDKLVVLQGTSCDLGPITLSDLSATPVPLTKAQIATLTLTLLAGTTAINSRNAQDIKDANGGTVTTAGVLTIELDAADNAIIDGTIAVGGEEEHVALLLWTWSDGEDTRTGGIELVFGVRKKVAAA